MKKRSKKATLSISIGAIVIIVIAFVVLGLALVLAKNIFTRTTEELPGIFEIAKLGKEPTADSPLTVRKDISIKRGESKKLDVGFYNTELGALPDVVIAIKNCLSVATGEQVVNESMPVLTSVSQRVETGEPAGYLVYLKEEKKLATGEYICEIVAESKSTATEYESVQISLIVTT